MTAAIPGGLSESARRVADLALRLTAWRSETGTPGEADFAGRFRALLSEIPYFRDHPENLRLIASHGDPMTHGIVALVRGGGRRTLLLTGHFDTVSTETYRDLRDLACDPPRLTEALIAELSARARTDQEDRALADLRGGDFVPGRGMLDMKSGIAAAVACLERFASDPAPHGNLMLVLTPDEERDSRGARSLRDALPAIAADFGLGLDAAINMDVTSDQGDGADGRAAYAGSIGKLLPFALVLGINAHAGYPFEGVSAQAMAADILARIEGNAALADRDAADVSPPPICLEARDLRDAYEVTTPERFWLAFNWLYHAMTADDLFARFEAEAAAGADAAVARFSAQAAAFGALSGKRAGATLPPPRLIRVEALRTQAEAAVGADFSRLYAEQEAEAAGIDNPLAATRRLTGWLVDRARLTGPAIVVGFAGLHYPPCRLNPDRAEDAALRRAVDAARARRCATADTRLSWKPYFQGISDMSFLGQPGDGGATVARNTPVSRLVDRPAPEAPRFPIVNIGPWGREFHQRLERVHAPYAFAVLPDLVLDIAKTFLADEA